MNKKLAQVDACECLQNFSPIAQTLKKMCTRFRKWLAVEIGPIEKALGLYR